MVGLRSTAIKFALFALVAIVLFAGLFTVMSNSVPNAQVWEARFETVSGLRAGDDVRFAGVKVGRVESISVVDNQQAEVTFRVSRERELTTSTRLSLRYQNLLGQRYLALTTTGEAGQPLEPGTTIPASATDGGFDLTALLNGFEPLFAVIDPNEVNRLATTIVSVLQGESATVESLLAQTAETTRFLADRDEVFGQVLTNLTPVLENLDSQSEEIDSTVVEFRAMMAGLAGERDVFADTIDDLGAMVASTSNLLEDIREPLAADVRSLRRTARLLAREDELLGRTVDQLPVGLSAFARAMSYGGFLNVYLCNLAVRAVGQVVWIPSPEGPNSEVCSS